MNRAISKLRYPLLAVGVGSVLSGASVLSLPTNEYSLVQQPLESGRTEAPLMMMVMSRDHSLFAKAYSDYSDLNADGRIDTSYDDTFSYSGYFDSGLCYAYASSRFSAAAKAGGTNGHDCSGQWSGNFLNWLSMSRMDVLRYVLYGGKRVVDSATQTVLQRAYVPSDLHAWVKHYRGSDISRFTPLTGAHSFCNVTRVNQSAPLIRVASGIYPEWASGATTQCILENEFRQNHTSNVGRPSSSNDLVVEVEVCRPGVSSDLRESYCKTYTSPGGAVSYKPTGLIQEYGESSRLRFGLISGSHGAPRSGGVLRRNIGKVAGNGAIGSCAAGDEINLHTGQFCNQTAGTEGIINTIERFTLTGWHYPANSNEALWSDCNIWGIRARRGGANQQLSNPGTGSQKCSGWGNPMSEMYAEALRYIAGETTATSAFTGGTGLPGMPTGLNWLDPYRAKGSGGNDYCANCSILMLSSSEPQYDSDEIPSVPRGVGDGVGATNAVGNHEGINGAYLVGRVGALGIDADEDICSAKNVSALGQVHGVCPDVPSLEGSYIMAGMAHKAKTTDMRPGLQGKPAGHKNTVTTYAVAMADSLPKFDLPLPGGDQIRLTPICQSNSSGGAAISSAGWSTCSLGSVDVGQVVSNRPGNAIYGRDLKYVGGQAVAGSYKIVWEDSTFGSDNDNDAINMITYCVGASCSDKVNPRNTTTRYDICYESNSPVCAGNGQPVVAANEVLVRIETLSAFAGYAMMTGLVVSGSNDDGVKKMLLRPGGQNGSYLSPGGLSTGGWTGPTVIRLRKGNALAGQLRSPLWYAAKYGGFKDNNGNDLPDAGEWDSKTSGEPDNYFFARDPSKLKDALREIFERAAAVSGPSGFGGSGVRINSDSFTISSAYHVPDESNDWTGTLTAHEVNLDGSAGNVLWEAGSQIPAPANRKLFVTTRHTTHAVDGTVASAVVAQPFNAANLGANDAARWSALGVPASAPSWLPANVNDLVNYLRGQEQANLRVRSSRLGSIVNSTPEVVSPKDDFGYGDWYGTGWRATLSNSYRTYRNDKASRMPMVYVGANAGILHGFNASRHGGDEIFGFIPAGARSHIYELADPDYEHRYFVDGKLTSADVYAAKPGQAAQWRTVLVGSTGAGGARSNGLGGSVFALDVSNPGSFSGSDVLWELTGETDNDLGFVMGKPSIVPVKSPTGEPMWVALFGNGPNSVNSEPVLYVVDIGSGRILRKLSPGNGYGGRNGLMTVAPVAVGNKDGLVDTVYAGDMRGNLWRFDLSNTNPATWGVAFGGRPLFSAQANFTYNGSAGIYAQPITGEIEVARGPGEGFMVYFGSGSYFIEGDNQTTDARYPQSFYAIWDNMGSTPVSSRSNLVAQSVMQGATASGYNTRTISYTPVNYPPARGWYVDLAISAGINTHWRGERVIGTPRIQNGMVMFSTYEPAGSVCSGKGINQLYAMDALTGAGSMNGVSLTWGGDPLCINNCGSIALDKDGATSSPVRDIAIFLPPSQRTADFIPPLAAGGLGDDDYNPAEDCVLAARTQGADTLYMPRQCGRQSWRQLR
ncbi:pilus assembly protein PilC [Lysobacteraceae bacterium NML07-0707]|nr:pilus assembly protein PilC [Xanthomonadaceae bacterium NML07-0707]